MSPKAQPQPIPKRTPISETVWAAYIEAFQMVGLPCERDYIDKYIRQPNWQSKKHWTQRQANTFMEHLVRLLRNARDEVPEDTAKALYRRVAWDVKG